MSRDEAEAVLAHEVSHVANGDMVTMALIQGVVNTFVVFLARVIGWVVDRLLFITITAPVWIKRCAPSISAAMG